MYGICMVVLHLHKLSRSKHGAHMCTVSESKTNLPMGTIKYNVLLLNYFSLDQKDDTAISSWLQ